jgi:hypothetical protein
VALPLLTADVRGVLFFVAALLLSLFLQALCGPSSSCSCSVIIPLFCSCCVVVLLLAADM